MAFDKNTATAEASAWARYQDSTDSWMYTCRPEPITLAVTRTWKPMHQVEEFEVWATEPLEDHNGLVVAGKWFDLDDGGLEWRPAATTDKTKRQPTRGVTLAELLEE